MPKDFSDYNHLLSELQKGNTQAFEYLYEHSRNRLYALANFILDDIEAARDLVQDFFTDFYAERHYERVEKALKTYLYNAIRNRALTLVRNRSYTNRGIEHLAAGKQTEENNMLEEIEYRLDENEIRQAIDNGIKNLPPMAERVFRMHYMEHLTHANIAEKLSISKFTVNNHMQRALKELRKSLKNKE